MLKHIQITWLDSHAWSSGWMRLSDALGKVENIKPIHSIGYVIKEEDEYVYIAQNQNEENVSNIYAIPKKSIIHQKEL